jgi:hypothetical protein
VVDCCITHDESKAQWETIFATQLEGLPILRVIVTHMHPDHIGLAHWLCARWNAPLWISATDYNRRAWARRAPPALAAAAAAFFASHGLTDPESMDKIRGRASYYPAWCRTCRAAFAACRTATPSPSAGGSGAALPAMAMRPSTWRCTATNCTC